MTAAEAGFGLWRFWKGAIELVAAQGRGQQCQFHGHGRDGQICGTGWRGLSLPPRVSRGGSHCQQGRLRGGAFAGGCLYGTRHHGGALHRGAHLCGGRCARPTPTRCVEIVKRCHRDMGSTGFRPGLSSGCSTCCATMSVPSKRPITRSAEHSALAWQVERLETAQVPLPIIFGHHDLLPTNFMDDGKRLWLIDWEYGGFGTAMFDLANIASNNSFRRSAEHELLEPILNGARPGNAARLLCHEDGKCACAKRCGAWCRNSISMRRASITWPMRRNISRALTASSPITTQSSE